MVMSFMVFSFIQLFLPNIKFIRFDALLRSGTRQANGQQPFESTTKVRLPV